MTFRPPTILDLANVKLQPARIDASALVIIDAQLEYETGRLALPGWDPLESTCRHASLSIL